MNGSIRPREDMPHLTNTPPEVLHHILQFLDPADIVTLPRVCSALHNFTKGNSKLYRDIYLNYLDTPKNLNREWETEVRDVARLQVICNGEDVDKKKPELDFVYTVVNRLLLNASPSTIPKPSLTGKADPSETHADSLNASLLKGLFKKHSTREAFLQRSSLFERIRHERHGRSPSKASTRQQSAKLHCLFGKPCLRAGPGKTVETSPYARSKVYDLRQHTQRTRWGPFMDDGSDRVDWEKMEAVMISLGYNIGYRRKSSSIFKEVWGCPFSGSWSGSYKQPAPSRDISSLEARDPYDITGTWYRIVCFLDYTDFFSFNFPAGDLMDRHTPRPALDIEEVTRIIMMKLEVTRIEDPGPDDGQDLPVVHFKGISRALDNAFDNDANSDIRGTVRLTREGEVRWTTFSIFHGQERWRSESVQIGGARSARGVFGHWFDRDYDVHGPAGPTAFWKGPSHETRPSARDLLPGEFFLANGNSIILDELLEEHDDDWSGEDDDDDGEEEAIDLGLAEELPGLLFDAGLTVDDVLQQQQQQAGQT